MVKAALDRKILRELQQLRAQVITISLLIICGLSLMIATNISYDSLHAARDSFYRDYRFAEIFAEFQAAPRGIINRMCGIPGVRMVEERIRADGLIEVRGQDEPAVGLILSLPSGAQPRLNQIFVREGRLPHEAQMPEVFLHEAFAAAHQLRPGDVISVLVKGQRLRFQIVGLGLSPEYVYALSAGVPLPDDRHFAVLWMAEPLLARLVGFQDSFNSLALTMSDSRAAEPIQKELRILLSPYGNKAIHGRMNVSSHMFLEDELKEQKTLSRVSPLVFLSIAIFLIHVIMSRLIHTHRPQIAVLKAIGYQDREIGWHYTKLIVVMMLFGTIPACGVGVFLGHLIVALYQDFFRFPALIPVVDPWILLLSVVIGISSGVLGGLTAIRSILRLQPAEALKPPVPPAYHAIFLDRLGMREKIRVSTRMTLRNLMLRPWRLGLTMLGMAAALGIMISSGSMKDMVDFLLKTQFQYVQREDISITLQHPVSVSGLQELAGIKGVQRVEGFRAAAVRIHHEHRQKETSLLGWPPQSELRQRLNGDLEPLPLPVQGLFLSRYFQREWGLKAGDRIELEILEGSFPRRTMTISGFSDELMGTTVHMRIDELWEQLDEEPGYNLIALKVDPHELSRLYFQLNQYPLVAAVSLRAALYHGFYESMGGMLQVSTGLLTLFAFIIAIGLIYNTVLMNFSERAREMATLQVLGFDHVFLFLLLMDVIMIQVFVSLIPGSWIGYQMTEWLLGSMQTETLSPPVLARWSTYAIGISTMLLALIFSAWSLFRMLRSLSLTEALKAKE
jgi:putative ABC transport system permease protein